MDNSVSNPRIRTFDEAFPENGGSDHFMGDTNSLLNPHPIPRISTAEYQQYIDSRPINVKFQVRISKETQTLNNYGIWVTETTLFWWADYNSFERFLREGILPAFNIPLESLIVGFTMLAKKGGRLITRISFESSIEGWDSAMKNLKDYGLSRNVDHGISSADTVIFLLRLRLRIAKDTAVVCR